MSQASPSEAATASTPTTPPTEKPKREGNDSLWKRARRTLGTNSLTFLQPATRPAGTASAPGSGPAAPSKRREQVRHAQRTHRQRTQNYIKTLESEVVRLRESEANLMQERDKLKCQVDSLRTTIILSNIPLPEGIEEPRTSPPPAESMSNLDMPATVSYSNDALDHPRLHVNFPQRQDLNSQGQGMDFSTPNYPIISPYQGHQPYANVSQSLPDLPNEFSLKTINLSPPIPSAGPPLSADTTTTTTTKADAQLDNIETAIDFVLALEHPCMAHIPYQNPPTAEPVNHMMMASTPLVARAPDPPQLHSTWSTNGAIIKELLNLSSGINLEGEITPVEAWHLVRNHPDFWKLDRDKIEELKLELSLAVRCCGFGAVLDEGIFWSTLNRILASDAVA